MLRRLIAFLALVVLVLLAAFSAAGRFSGQRAAARADGLYAAVGSGEQEFDVTPGTFSGSYTPKGACGVNAISIPAGTGSIDVSVTATLPTNDIAISLLDPSGTPVASSDVATSPEVIHYSASSIVAGSWNVKVCESPAPAVVSIPPTTYTGVYTATPLGTPTVPGVGGGSSGTPTGTAGTPTPARTPGNLRFSPETIVDPQRTEGEPVNFFAPDGTYWESGPFGTTSQQSWIHKSTDGGLEFHETSPVGLRPDAPPGGGDTDVVADDQGNVYFTDLEGLTNVGTSVSNDGGNTWRKNTLAAQEAGVDREWFAMDDGTTTGAGDNTVFLTYRQVPLGPQILSSPGSTGPNDQVGGLVWTNAASANGQLNVSSGAPCGKLIFDPVKRNLYLPCGQSGRNPTDHIELVVGHVAPGQRTGIDFVQYELPASPGGGAVNTVFPWVGVDKAGNLMAVWIDRNDRQVYETVSKDEGKTWTTPVQVNKGTASDNTNTFPEVVGGDPGTFVVTWYGSDASINSDAQPANTDPASAKFPWYGRVAVITKADTLAPTIAQQNFTEHPMHYGQVCNSGTTCTSGRTMADYFDVGIDQHGAIRIVFDDESSQYRQAHLMEVRQLLTGSEPKQPMADPTGDAQMPHYSPTGPGPNLPQADFTKVALSQPSDGVLRVQMTLADLSKLTPPVGKSQLVWLTRFQAKSTSSAGEAYRIFYVGARSTNGGTPTFFAGSGDGATGCLQTGSSGCKILIYPEEQTLTSGAISGNTITIDVSLQNGFGSGRPIDGDTLYSVTALSYGQNGDADIYLEGDATHSFDYSLGNASPVSVPQPTAKPSGGGSGGGGGSAGSGGGNAGSGGGTVKGSRGVRSVRGHGLVGAGRLGTASFTIGARSLVYVDRRHHVVLRAPIRTVRFGTIAARITGIARVNGKRVRFAAVAVDHGTRGDVFRIAWNGGPTHGGRLRKGGVTVT